MSTNSNNKPNNDESGEIISWVIVFIMMVVFWPVGLLLLLKKLNVFASPGKNRSNFSSGSREGSSYRAEARYNEAFREAEAVARETISAIAQAARETGFAMRQSTQTAGTWAPYHQPQPLKPNIKKERTTLERRSGKFVSVILLLISVALFILGISAVVAATGNIGAEGFTRWTDFFLGGFLIIGGFISFFARNIRAKRLARYKRYYVYISGRSLISITDIARTSGLSERKVKRDLQAMINEGYLGENAYINRITNLLVLIPGAEDETPVSADTSAATAKTVENEYMAILLELRHLDDAIADIAISNQIVRIEEVTAKIFRIVEENPEKAPQIRRFKSYYIPTTLKLLKSYETLEKQGIKGENIDNAKENIGHILQTLAVGFEQQLDQLFSSDALDIAADMNVIENLMHQDGLTVEKPELKTMEGV